MENYIEKIHKILEKTGWPQTKLASEIGVTFATVNRWLNGHAKPHPGYLLSIERIYRTTVGIEPLTKDEIAAVIKKVLEKKKQFPGIKKILQKKEIAEEFLLELTYNSDAIEGSTLTKKETEAIIFDKATIEDKSLIEHMEVTNHSVVLKNIFAGKYGYVMDEDLIKGLHRSLMQGIRPDAGEYARHKRGIRGVDLALPHPQDIPEEMKWFCKRVNDCKGHPIQHIAKMHADFEAIHPFGDGNGRVGRLIMIILLIANGLAPCVISVNDKAAYYEYLEYAQKKSETHFIRFTAEAVLKGYKLIEKTAA